MGLTALEGEDMVLPYPTRLVKEKQDFDMGQVEAGNAPTSGAKGGQPGNSNAQAGSPPKSSQDSAAGESSPADSTTGRAERGANQDSNPPK